MSLIKSFGFVEKEIQEKLTSSCFLFDDIWTYMAMTHRHILLHDSIHKYACTKYVHKTI